MRSKSQEREEKMKSVTRKLKEEQKEKKKDKKRREKYDTSPTKAKKSELLYFPFEN